MSATDIVSISAKIKEVIDGIPESATFDGFASVFEYAPKLDEVTGSPICVITPLRVSNRYLTTHEDERIWTFGVSIYVLSDGNIGADLVEQESKRAAGHVIDEIQKAEHNSETEWYRANISIGRWGYTRGTFRVVDLELELLTLPTVI